MIAAHRKYLPILFKNDKHWRWLNELDCDKLSGKTPCSTNLLAEMNRMINATEHENNDNKEYKYNNRYIQYIMPACLANSLCQFY